MKPIFKEIRKSFDLFSKQENWDDDGALAINEKAYSRSIEFLMRLINKIGNNIQKPMISLCNDGSIDICWREEKIIRLLVNVGENKFCWYGDNYDTDITEGKQIECYNEDLEKWIEKHYLENKHHNK